MRVWGLGLLLWAGTLGAAPPADFRLVRVVTRNAIVFSQADLQSPQKGRVWFRASFQLLDDEPVNGFWKILYTDREAYIKASETRREAGQGDPSYQPEAAALTGTAAAAASPTAQSARDALSARIAPLGTPASAPASAPLNEAQTRLMSLPPKAPSPRATPMPTPELPAADASGAAKSGPGWAPEQAPKWLFYVPLMWGLGGSSTPAFRPSSASDSTRPIRDAFAWGLGLEARPKPWLTVYGEWTYNTHHTPSADRGQPALPVGLSDSAAVSFSQGDLDYAMQAHVVSMGLRLGHYWPPVMPWVSVGLSEAVWNASYLQGGNIQGQASGAVTALEAGLGMDIYFKLFGAGVAKLTPTLGFIAPLVSASMPDVGGTGLAWPDASGTPVRAPLRAGIQLGIGF
jgi:hypothetical protein